MCKHCGDETWDCWMAHVFRNNPMLSDEQMEMLCRIEEFKTLKDEEENEKM